MELRHCLALVGSVGASHCFRMAASTRVGWVRQILSGSACAFAPLGLCTSLEPFAVPSAPGFQRGSTAHPSDGKDQGETRSTIHRAQAVVNVRHGRTEKRQEKTGKQQSKRMVTNSITVVPFQTRKI